MYDLIIELGSTIAKHGLSLSALGTAIFVLLKQRKVKRILRRRLPWLLRDDSDVMNYEARQIRIEQDVRDIKAHLGVTECAESKVLLTSTEKRLSKSSQVDGLSARYAAVPMHQGLTIISRGNRKMKTLMQKYSSTKLQALVVATVMNLALLGGYLLDIQDIQSKVEAWMPMANLVVQTILTIAYQWSRATVDKAEIKAEVSNATYTTPEDAGSV